ncbi:catalase [Gilbertella persicaria]|uniref:catalase n=1 Tax=Gilbertella persicaria TaxID=101096 RepID=UPI00221FE4A3|nr:catalase [Gilbertella persicaria]KAI8066276.1 catalase [Gilbertella persicaria]
MSNKILTTSNGCPVDNDQTSITAGVNGPILISDFHLIDKISHFDRERIPERVVHAKGAGAHGEFVVTHDVSHLTKAKFLNGIGKKTPMFARFSTVGGEKGSADTARDPRGFSLKFYTEEGNFDVVGNNTPVFFIRDPSKFPDFIHTQKRDPQTNLKNPEAKWDFYTSVPESLHQVTILMSNYGTPDGFRFMHGYGSHTFKLVDNEGKFKYFKWHFKAKNGSKNLKAKQAKELEGSDPDYATRDLFEAIERGEYPSWDVFFQVMEPEDAKKYKWNIFDVTKVWPHKDYPLIPVGTFTLNRNPENYFAETEQSAFSPSHMVPGIDVSADRMLQGRLFSYPDAHRYRLGVNYHQIPINRPRVPVNNYQRDGFMAVEDNGGSAPNYGPNSMGGPVQNNIIGSTFAPEEIEGMTGRFSYQVTDDDFVQPGNLYRLMSDEDKNDLADSIAEELAVCKQEIVDKAMNMFERADPDYRSRVEKALAKSKN